MAMTAASLKARIDAKIVAQGSEPDYWQAVAEATVEEIQANAAVSTAGTATAVQPGAGTAPVTSTGTVS